MNTTDEKELIMAASNQAQIKNDHIGILDALRGFLAFWVYYGHVKQVHVIDIRIHERINTGYS